MNPIGYHIMHEPTLPPLPPSQMFRYIVAQNGVFVECEREGLRAVIPVAPATGPMRGLFSLESKVELLHPRVPRDLVLEMLIDSWKARDDQGGEIPAEELYYLSWTGEGWYRYTPHQDRSAGGVTPLVEAGDPAYSRALIDWHSHGKLRPFFSPTDNADEKGVRFYLVWGLLFSRPTILARVGIFGHYFPIPATLVCELPELLRDGYEESLASYLRPPEITRQAAPSTERGLAEAQAAAVPAALDSDPPGGGLEGEREPCAWDALQDAAETLGEAAQARAMRYGGSVARRILEIAWDALLRQSGL
jgi:PRTRC genetic system protein A